MRLHALTGIQTIYVLILEGVGELAMQSPYKSEKNWQGCLREYNKDGCAPRNKVILQGQRNGRTKASLTHNVHSLTKSTSSSIPAPNAISLRCLSLPAAAELQSYAGLRWLQPP